MDFEEIKHQKMQALEARYTLAMSVKDQEKMDSIVGELMSFNAIEKDDARVKSLKRRKIPNFYKDYRSGDSFVSNWVLGESPYNIRVVLHTEEHEGKRIEGVYEGTISVPSREMLLDVRAIKSTGQLSRVKEDIARIDKRCNREPVKLGSIFEEKVASGEYVAYKIATAQGQNFLKSDMGYAIAVRSLEKDIIKVTIILDSLALKTCWVEPDKAGKGISSVVTKELKELNACKVVTKVVATLRNE